MPTSQSASTAELRHPRAATMLLSSRQALKSLTIAPGVMDATKDA